MADAPLTDDPVIKNGRSGIGYGLAFGSYAQMVAFAELMNNGVSRKLNATSYIQMMSHTAAVNIGLLFGVTGRIIPTSTACTAGSMAIGYACEAIRWGKADVMIAGGADELDASASAVFDTMFATSSRTARPNTSPRPFHLDRDALVIGD